MTDALGNAQTTLTLARYAGVNTVEAQVPGVAGSPVIFTATGTVGPATELLLTSGNSQTGAVAAALPLPLVVTARDVHQNGVPGVSVDFLVSGGGGSLSALAAVTDADGQAQTGLVLGTATGPNSVTASANGLSGSPITFTATAVAGPASRIVLTSGNNQIGTPSAALGLPFVVGVEDAYGNAVMGASVGFSATVGAGQLSTVNVTTDASGHAQTTLTMGPTVGIQKVEATATGLTNSPIVFTATMASVVPHVAFVTGTSPFSLAVGDVNADGKRDLVVANLGSSAGSVSVLRNTTVTGSASPTFAAKTDFATGPKAYSVAVADLNADGMIDIAVANQAANTVSVLLNTTSAGATTISFASKVDFATGTDDRSVAIADINADGKPDLVIGNFGANSVSVLRNTTSAGASIPTFAAKTDFAVGTQPIWVATGDFNGDGKSDVAVANNASSSVSVLLNTTASGASSVSFSTKVDFATGSAPLSVAVGDVNADGKPDLATTVTVQGWG